MDKSRSITRTTSSSTTLYEPESFPEEFIRAILSGNVEAVQYLADSGVGICLGDSWAVYEACLQGVAMVYALSMNPRVDLNPEIPGHMGDTAFHFLLRTPATRFQYDKLDTIRFLLLRGVDPLLPDRRGNNALHILAGTSEPDSYATMQLLLCKENMASELVRRSCLSCVDIRSGCGPLARACGSTALILAVRYNQRSCVRLLLESGADPNILGEFERTPLFWAVMGDFVAVAKTLLDHGARLENNLVARSSEMAVLFNAHEE